MLNYWAMMPSDARYQLGLRLLNVPFRNVYIGGTDDRLIVTFDTAGGYATASNVWSVLNYHLYELGFIVANVTAASPSDPNPRAGWPTSQVGPVHNVVNLNSPTPTAPRNTVASGAPFNFSTGNWGTPSPLSGNNTTLYIIGGAALLFVLAVVMD